MINSSIIYPNQANAIWQSVGNLNIDSDPIDYPSLQKRIEYHKNLIKIFKKVKKIDPEAKEINITGIVDIYGINYSSVGVKEASNFYSEKIWDNKKLKYRVHNKSSSLTLYPGYSMGDVYCLDVFLEFKISQTTVKIFCCNSQPILHIYNDKCHVSYMSHIESLNLFICNKVSRQLVKIIAESGFSVMEEDQLSSSMKKYLTFR